jgi:CRISPR type III-A-associated RAMP protein Csm4
MRPATLVRFRPTTPWRVGPDSGSCDQTATVLHSDTLYSAVCNAMRQLGALEEWLSATAPEYGTPAVRFSSAFPFQRTALFAPPPAGLWPPAVPASSHLRWKGASLVPLGLIRQTLRGEPLDEEQWSLDAHSGCLLPVASRSGTGPFRLLRRSFAAVDRISGASAEPRSLTCLQFAPGSGLWFVAEFANPTAYAVWSPRLQMALRLLADSGVGGLRSCGFGRARPPEFQPGTLPGLLLPGVEASSRGPQGWWVLSVFNPAPSDEVTWNAGDYRLLLLGGRTAGDRPGLAKLATRMVREGSVLVAGAAPRGRVVNVAPPGLSHPVYRAGFALALSIPWQVPS